MENLEGAVQKTFKKVIVIDDAYAPAETNDLDGEAVTRFTNALLDEPRRVGQLKREFKKSSLDPSIPADVEVLVQDRAAVQRLWVLRTRQAWAWLNDTLFLEYLDSVTQKQSELSGLEQLFSRYRWKVEKIPSLDAAASHITASQLIFLDFFLKGETGVEKSLERAAQIAHLVIQARQSDSLANYPLVVLMSSRPGAADQQEEFKTRTGLRADFFRFIEKGSINESGDAMLERLVEDYSGKQALARLLDEYWLAAIRSATALRQNLTMVEPSELALLHEAELGVEEAVLPDYLSWLVSESLASGLLEDARIRTLGQQLPEVIAHRAFPGAVPPGSRLADMYVRSVMRLDVNDDIAETKNAPVELGDLFAKLDATGSPSEFLLVVDQSCDLARPDSSKKTSVLCLKCQPQLLSDMALAFYRTAYLKDSSMADLVAMQVAGSLRYYLAKWELVNPATPALSDLTKRKSGLKRLARLKPVSALARQEGLTQRVGRIGEPVAPPLVTAYRAKLVLHGKNDFKREFDASKESWASAVVIQGRHMPKPDPKPAGPDAADKPTKRASKPKTSTTLSLTTSFGDWLLGKLDRAKLDDSQAASQGRLLVEALKAGGVQRVELSGAAGDQGLSVLVRKASMSKPKLTIQVVFDKTIPPDLKSEPLLLLLTPYKAGAEDVSDVPASD